MKIAFVITNDKHHHEMMLPVAERVAGQHELACWSFCEFRGLRTPAADWRALGAEVSRIPPFVARPSTTTTDQILALGESAGATRSRLHGLVWTLLLRPLIRTGWPDLVVVPNDAAFPGSHLCEMLRRRKVPFGLVQEGIRFPWGSPVKVAYGSGGASWVACWGPGAVAFFAAQGVPKETLHAVGNPRYDAIVRRDWDSEVGELRITGALPADYVLFVSNPIDDQGFCSREAKLASFAAFCRRAVPHLAARGCSLAVKLHGREVRSDFESSLGGLAQQVRFLGGAPIHATIRGSRSVVVWASTAGLEAVLHERPLGVLETPGRGFIFDYVERGAGIGLRADDQLDAKLDALLDPSDEFLSKASDYLDWHLSDRGRSAERVAQLIEQSNRN